MPTPTPRGALKSPRPLVADATRSRRPGGRVLAKVAGGSSFDSMKAAHEKREIEGARKMGSANHFRSGKSGGWRDVFTVTQSDQVRDAPHRAAAHARRLATLSPSRHAGRAESGLRVTHSPPSLTGRRNAHGEDGGLRRCLCRLRQGRQVPGRETHLERRKRPRRRGSVAVRRGLGGGGSTRAAPRSQRA